MDERVETFKQAADLAEDNALIQNELGCALEILSLGGVGGERVARLCAPPHVVGRRDEHDRLAEGHPVQQRRGVEPGSTLGFVVEGSRPGAAHPMASKAPQRQTAAIPTGSSDEHPMTAAKAP